MGRRNGNDISEKKMLKARKKKKRWKSVGQDVVAVCVLKIVRSFITCLNKENVPEDFR